jgi:zinc transport system ATP-binding protein
MDFTINTYTDSQKKSCGLCCTKIENINVKYGKTVILDNVNLHIHCGEITALIGPNGAGKSTLLKAVLGQIRHSGEMKFLDVKGKHNGKPAIGYVPQYLNFDRTTPASVLDVFLITLSNIPVWIYKSRELKKKILEILSIVQAEYLIDRRIGDLSGGELQRVLLALALYPVPDLLLLDEPVSGVDEKGMNLFYNIVSDLRKNYDLSIVLVSHDLELVSKFANRVILLNKKIICSGSPREVYLDSEFIGMFGSIWAKGLE